MSNTTANCCVNKSGTSVPVYDWNGRKIGDIMNREFYTLMGGEGGIQSIYFKGPSGNMLNGLLKNYPRNSVSSISNYPYGTVNINGITYITFYMRRTMNLYNYAGQVVGSVAAGKRVACKSGLASRSSGYLKAINFAEKRSGGWDSMSDSTGSYGFVDTGLRESSSYSGIALYGNW